MADKRSVDRITFDMVAEVLRAEEKFPVWPTDIVHGVAIMVEEAGEAVKAALDCAYGRCGTTDAVRAELVQTAAMCFRAIVAIDKEAHDD